MKPLWIHTRTSTGQTIDDTDSVHIEGPESLAEKLQRDVNNTESKLKIKLFVSMREHLHGDNRTLV